MMKTYHWIQYHRLIQKKIPCKSINRLFISDAKQLYLPVDFYCDRTCPENNISIPAHLSLPKMQSIAQDWDQLTFDRCQELGSILSQGQKCMIQWSGGIDSTYIISAMIESLDPVLLDNVTIGLSAASLWENPYFYRDQILPRFKNIQDIEHSAPDPEILTVTGDIGDKIACPEIILQWLYESSGPQDLSLHRDALLKFLSKYNQSLDKSAELYDMAVESAWRADIDLITVSDLLWWISFNYAFVGMYFSKYGDPWYQDSLVTKNTFSWFCDPRWQIWSMNQSGRWPTRGDDWHVHYKKHAKEIIYRLDNNQHYLNWKQKIHSAVPLELSWKNTIPPTDWILAVDSEGNKYFTNDSRLEEDVAKLGIDL